MSRPQKLLVVLGLAAALALAGAAGWRHLAPGPESRLRRAEEALRRGDRDRAEALALALEAGGYPDHARLLRGEILSEQGRDAEAVAVLNQVRDQGDLLLRSLTLSGRCLLRMGDLREAERVFRYVLDQGRDDLEVHRGLADIYYHQGALPQALDHFAEVARLDPADGRPHQFMAYVYKDLDQRDRAIASYEEALRRDLSDRAADGVRQELAELLVKRGNYGRALEVLDQAGPELADNPKVLALRAEALAARDGPAPAAALLDRALAEHPKSPDLLRGRAALHLQAGEARPAAELLERALEGDRHDFAARFQLAQAYERLGRKADAAEQRRLGQQTQEAFDELTRLNKEAMARPWDAAVRRRLAAACEKLDRPDLAAMWLQAAAAATPLKN